MSEAAKLVVGKDDKKESTLSVQPPRPLVRP